MARARGTAAAAPKPPLEYSILYTATLCLLATGAVMVYSASSAESFLNGSGDPSQYLKRYLLFGLLGVAALHLASRHGLRHLRAITPPLLLAGFALTFAVMLPGVGVQVNGATRWLAAGPVQFQPSELLKLALVIYAAQVLATRPEALKTLRGLCRPLLIVVGAACLLLLMQPDMGTAMVICFSIAALTVAAGVSMRHLAIVFGVLALLALLLAVAEPYRRERLVSFVDPWGDSSGGGFQAVQAMIAIGSGGFFGVGLGESVQKIFYLPEAHTDMILAIVGEELGVLGMIGLASLYGLIAYAGFRAAKLARDRHSKLLAAGITSLILCQATLNYFAVLGMAPLTGVPLPFVSYGSSNLVVLMAGMGLLLNVAATGGQAKARRSGGLVAIDGGGRRGTAPRERSSGRAAAGGGRGGRNGGARGARAGSRRRAQR
jgi:cell division protein FtsW